MRRTLATLLLVALVVAAPVAAAPVDAVQGGPTVADRVLEVVTSWVAKLGMAKSDPDDERDDLPPDELGLGLEPIG